MPLLTTNQQINAGLVATGMQCANHLASAAVLVNRMVTDITALSNGELTAWLNSQESSEMLALFTAHGQLGSAINTAAIIAGTVLADSGITLVIPECDVRSVADKLAPSRILAFVDGVFSVTDAPTPEPEEE